MNSRATLYDQRGDLSLALALQDEAIRRRTAARTTLARLLARRAELHAKGGSDSATMSDIDSAEGALNGPEDW